MRCRLGELLLDTDRYLLERDGESVHVEPQVFDVLAHLVANRDRVVTKEELLDEVWGDRFVGESTLASRIKDARRILGDDGSRQEWIRTVHGRGYHFVGGVEALEPSGPDPSRDLGGTSPELDQRIHFCTAADGTRLAYATIGTGPPLVRAAHWITHLDYDWHSPVWRHWLEGLAAGRMLIRYDERGCGMSDHDPGEITFDTFVDDLETVVDACGLETFPLVGVSQGGPVAIDYAHRHPERVEKLILIGSYAQGRGFRGDAQDRGREAAVQLEMIRLGWGRDEPSFRRFFTSTFIPDAAPELWDSFADLLRRTTSADNAARIFDACATIDVVDQARELEVPTLILHARDELRVPFEEGRHLATLIPDSRLVPLASHNHLLRPDEPAWEHMMREVRAFLDEPAG